MRQLKITNKITARESLALDKYLNDIGKIPMLTADDEAELARRIRQGDDDAMAKLTRANLRFVVSVAKQYQNQGLSLSDLINEGNVGLMKAAKRFDETKGFKFISYAVWWIRQSILQAIVEYSRIVRLPLNKVGSYNKVNEAYLAFIQQFEREPSNEELGELLEMNPREVGNMLKGNGRHVSVDAPLSGEEGDSTMLDVITDEDDMGPDSRLMEQSLKDEVKQGLSILNIREVEVLSAYYGLEGQKPLTLEEIGEMYGLTRERVRQIKERAIRRLRKSYNRNNLRSYLG
ncbi:MAG TPA: RNA polymerase sigma factor RpoD/SigA [Haliscomenobacter sp.]|uniref:sigma-70 family RNA polymerase sigma factor n=1 Tax=Haliscomenobacter sp. TaxID=2717303 RepID=UPI001D1FF618|nr:RNA polymerase sigma factor RpoD/SigA [Haliscomenobacter sp.]MBK9488776.1 RNA polymerase sigma factor RpoD/SigA [Haliscomenobacter sp.]HOY19177.1 RNA polymerase sigma factor RpoD/SigA [Haliscomenobacter sp.]HPH21705.1 RNA polymerase sigma factor RpoD/SigA [Haliscomenobacter sp.]